MEVSWGEKNEFCFFLLVIFAVVATVDVSIDDGDVYCECSECVMIIDLVR